MPLASATRRPGSLRTLNWMTAFALGIGSLGIFLIQIEHPATPNFDEFHYVPAARAFADGIDNKNLEHPPLGKELMAIGLSLAGDRPLGWRLMSAVFGALTLVAMFVWGLLLFGSFENALLVAAITFFNQLLYVQARIGMLDTFMFAFLAWAFVAATWALRAEARPRRAWTLCGAACGLAIACKWAALIPWISLAAFSAAAYCPDENGRLRANRIRDWAVWMIAIPLLAYFATFIPFFFLTRDPAYTIGDILKMQPEMWGAQLRVVSQHPYMSQWYDWPLLKRPIWYAFDREPENAVRGVLLLGNPWVMWTGFAAWLYLVWEAFRLRSGVSASIAALYAVLYFPWVVIPRKVSFYYYYYPAGMILSLVVVAVLARWDRRIRWAYAAIAAAIFVYFLPILSASKIPQESFIQWMWLRSWI